MGEQCGTLTLGQAAALLGWSESTVKRRVKAGVLPTLPKEHGQALRFPAAAIRRIADEGQQESRAS